MFLKIIGIFAEFERENLSVRTKLGFERKVKEGYTLASYNISYGYTRETGQKIQQIEPNEARIVKEIYEMYVDKNKSMTKIAKTLNERKIKSKNGVTWDTNTVKRILNNPTYIGKVRYSMRDDEKYFEVDGHHEPIISDELYNLAQEKIKNMPKISNTKNANEDAYFCGVLVCGICNSKLTTHRNYAKKTVGNERKQYGVSYKCRKNIYHNDDIACKAPRISHTKVEQAFIEYIQKVNDIMETDYIDIEDDSPRKEQELLKHIADYENKISNMLSKKKQLMERYVNENMDFEDYKEMLAVFNESYENLDSELQRLKADVPKITENPKISTEDIVLNIKQNWDNLSDNERMIFLQRFVKKIVPKIEKVQSNSNTVKIESIEFNLSSDIALKQNHKTNEKVYKKTSIRKTLNNRTEPKSKSITKKAVKEL